MESPAFWRTQEMLLIQQVMAQLGRGLHLDPLLREMLHLLSELLGLNRGRIVLPDADGSLRIRHAYGLTAAERGRGVYRKGEGITGRVVANGQLIIVQDVHEDATFLGRSVPRELLPQEPVAFIATPIKLSDGAVGVLACHRLRRKRRPLSDDITILQILATIVGQLIQLHDSLARRTEALEQHNRMLSSALQAATARYGIIGTSPALMDAISQLEQVSSSSAGVLLLGQSGTGKELFARALHLASPRREKPFVKVNCAAIPEALFESELFGHERGAFTGATEARIGLFEQADNGTIFLDEIGELPLGMQTKLLRTLQEGSIVRLGGKRETQISIRIVAATNRNLQSEVALGRFREDLFYRLNVIPIRLPSLADRRGDIPLIVSHFINRANQANQRNVFLEDKAVELLQEQPWPGNIRQLSNVVERIVLLSKKPLVTEREVRAFLMDEVDRPASAFAHGQAHQAPAPTAHRSYVSSDSHTAEQLMEAVRRSSGNKTHAAHILGMTVRQFNYRWRKFGLDRT